MKRVCLCLLISFLLVSLFGIIRTDGASLSEEELNELVDNAILVRSILGARRYPWDYEDISSDVVELIEENNNVEFKYIYRPILDSYDEKGIKALVYSTFSEEYAGELLQINSDFFNDFREIDGKNYYREWGFTLLHGYKEYKRDNSRSVAIIEESEKSAEIEAYFLPDLKIRFSLYNDNGLWKISAIDNKAILLKANPSFSKSNAFSTETAIEAIRAVIMEGYYYTSLNSLAADTYYELGGSNKVFEGILAYPDTWKKYLSEFATSDVVKRTLFKNNAVNIRADGLIERAQYRESMEMYIICEENGPSPDRLTIICADDNKALCSYRLGYDNNEITTLSFEFVRTDKGWIISGGDFIEKLDSLFVFDDNPLTGDNLHSMITILLIFKTVFFAFLILEKNKVWH